ncbi:MAG: hypothetical protein JXR22_06965 [Prolixibacteraceae bacterium]|nr:hypothetical protein [Prolixibacteraceae bacterium]
METSEIIKEIEKLPVSKRFLIIERTIQSIKRNEEITKMETAASALLTDYESDYELTSFTGIDLDEFYEAK